MLFNSNVFLIFFAVVYPLYLLFSRNLKAQNLILLTASFIFYGYWDWRFLFLLLLSTSLNFWIAQQMDICEPGTSRRQWLFTSVAFNLSILGFFKYYNFFAGSLSKILSRSGLDLAEPALGIVLPVGISFYTFQEMGYVMDVYRKEIKATRHFSDYALFISFFPQLVAGPIERAHKLLSQVMRPRSIRAEQVNAAIFLLLTGYFKKLVIADNLGRIADQVFDHYAAYYGLDILIAALCFTFQIYCDFSGYSDIGRGLAKLMGFELMVNFKLPYWALNPADFWARWHVSLSSWLRDYLYIPLGGNRKGLIKTFQNLAMTMILGGLWHGASWNFVLWGAYHGFLLILYKGYQILKRGPMSEKNFRRSGIENSLSRVFMFGLAVMGWILFRARTMEQAGYLFSNLGLAVSESTLHFGYLLIFFSLPLLALEAFEHRSGDLLAVMRASLPLRILIYGFLVVWIFLFSVRESIEFIYFQF